MEHTEDWKTTDKVFQNFFQNFQNERKCLKRKKSCFSRKAAEAKQKGRYKKETSNTIKAMLV